ncbi:hypothetical protein [Acinetobacter sp. Root1280]|uniref:hypothetical protein n=1 Tax=Acinetobacter sp. Root1280 TaxID=1736444 RepID=UPI0006F41CC8|nr:hypothetical protein [Acinetobacter sp. Root1280]
MTNKLDYEFNRYLQELPNLSCNEGMYVLIFKDEPLNFFNSYDDALKVGYAKYGLEPFLVQQVTINPTPMNFFREVGLQCRA